MQASVYYLAVMLEGGEDARFIARRMIVLASEDIGNADPQALLVAVAAAQAVEHVGLPEARLNLAQAAVYLARAPKSNASYRALDGGDRRRPRARPPPAARRRSARRPIPARRKLGRGEGYLYPHDDPAGFEVDCLPDELKGRVYYTPSGAGRGDRRGAEQDQRIAGAERARASSTASAAVSFASSRIGFTSTSSSESSRPDSATSSSARCASR